MRAFAADDGEPIHAAISGDGPPVVLLHGWTASHETWTPVAAGLSRSHAVYRWDARGHGPHSLTTATVPTVQRMARDLRNLLQHYHLREAALVGHSMGALTIWEYVRAFGTDRVAKLCLIDQSPKLVTDGTWKGGIYGDFDHDRLARFLADLDHDFAESVLRLAAFGNNAAARQRYEEDSVGWRLSRESLRRLDPAPLIATWRSLAQADYRDVLPAIDVPTLLVYGGESNFYGPETARYVRDHIPGADLRIYEGADHSPHMGERERFKRDLAAFLAN